MLLHFSKYHGLGNDFAVIDGRDLDLTFPGTLSQKLCDRYRGLGADSILVWTGSLLEPVMTIVDGGGNIQPMNGNALRCFVKHLLDRHLPQTDALHVHTGAGLIFCTVTRDDSGSVIAVALRIGPPKAGAATVRTTRPSALVEQAVQVGKHAIRLTPLRLETQLAVTFDPLPEKTKAQIAPLVGTLPLFTEPAEVAFAQVLPGAEPQMQVEVYQPTRGWDPASGAGAVAAALVAVETGRLPRNREIAVKLAGGWMAVTVADDGGATMQGPAVHVYDGSIHLPRLLAGEA